MGTSAAVAAAIIGAGALSAGATAASGVMGANAAAASDAQNRSSTLDTNALNAYLGLTTRGVPLNWGMVNNAYNGVGVSVPAQDANVSAAVLPYYFGQGGESGLAQNALATTNAELNAYGNPTQTLAHYQQIANQMAPAQAQADQTASNLFNGQLQSTLLAQAAPVQAANTAGAQAQVQAGLQALSQQLNQIDAIQAKKGFTGDSAASNMLKFGARQNIAQGGAGALSAANLANAQMTQGIQSGVLSSQLSNVNLPNSQAQSDIGAAQAPLTALSSQTQNAQAPLAFFKMGQNSFQPLNTPIQGAIPSGLQAGLAAAGSGISSIGNALTQANQNAQNNALMAKLIGNQQVANFPQPGNGGTAIPNDPNAVLSGDMIPTAGSSISGYGDAIP